MPSANIDLVRLYNTEAILTSATPVLRLGQKGYSNDTFKSIVRLPDGSGYKTHTSDDGQLLLTTNQSVSGEKTFNDVLTVSANAYISGNVGIGTTSPDSKLSILGEVSISATTGLAHKIVRDSTGLVYNSISNTGNSSVIGIESSAGGSLIVGGQAYASVFSTQSTVPMHFGTSNNVRMTITSAGYIGFGNTSPVGDYGFGSTNQFYVYSSTINAAGDLDADGLLRINFHGYDNGTTRFRDLYIDDGKENSIAFFEGSTLNTQLFGDLILESANVIRTGTSSASDNKYLRITGGGDAGSDRGATIDLYGNEQVAGTGILDLIAGNTIGGDIRLWTNGSERCRILYNGDVGIGTSSPGYKLHVVGTSNPTIAIQETGSSSIGRMTAHGSGVSFGTITGDPVYFYANNSEKMRITSGGNFGIGATSPSHTLTVNSTGLAANVPAVWLANLENQSERDGTVVSTIDNGSDVEVFSVRTNTSTYNGGTQLFMVRGDGLVTVNGDIVLPDAKSIRTNTVSGSDNEYISFSGGGSDSINRGAVIRLYGNDESSGLGSLALQAGNIPSANVLMYTNSLERLRITSAGYIGINASDPSYALDVAGSVSIDTRAQASNPRLYFGHDNFFLPTSNFIEVDRNVENMNFQIGGNVAGKFNQDGTMELNEDLILQNAMALRAGTVSGSDDSLISICGGGADSNLRGANIHLYGNDVPDLYGTLDLSSGVTTTASLRMYTYGSERIRITSAGAVCIGTTSATLGAGLDVRNGGINTVGLSIGESVVNYPETGKLKVIKSGTPISENTDTVAVFQNNGSGTNLSIISNGVSTLNLGTTADEDRSSISYSSYTDLLWLTINTQSCISIDENSIIDYRGTMDNSTKDPTTASPDDWVEIKIGGTTRYVPAYAAS